MVSSLLLDTASMHVVCHIYLSMFLYLDVMLLTVVPAAVTDKSIHGSRNTSNPVNVSLQWIVSSNRAVTPLMC